MEHRWAQVTSGDTGRHASLGIQRLLCNRLEGYNLVMDLCHQASLELLGVIIKASVVQLMVLKKHSIKLGAVRGPHFVFHKVSNHGNTTSDRGGGAAKGCHDERARRNLCTHACAIP